VSSLTRRHAIAAGLAVLATPLLPRTSCAGTVREGNALASRTLGHAVPYALYLPPDYERDLRHYPVIYLLHGGGDGQPSDWFRLAGLDRILDLLIADGTLPPCIAVAPDGRRPAGDARATYFLDDSDGGYRWAEMFVQDFVPGIEERYRAAGTAGMRGLMGLSMGGQAAVLNQLRHPDLFAGAAALSSAFRTPQEVMAMDQPSFDLRFGAAFGAGLSGEARLNEAWRAADVVDLAKHIDPLPYRRIPRLYLDLAADDPFFAGNAAVHIALRDAGILHRFQVREGKHDWPYWQAAFPGALDHMGRIFTRGYGE